jgi:hypothetical protein
LDLVKAVLAPPYNSATQYTPVNLWEHIASLSWDTSGDRKEDSTEGRKYILHGMIEQGQKNDFLAIEHMTSKCHLSTFMRSAQTEWIEAGQMKEDPNYEELVKNYIEKHLGAMSNLTKEEKRLEILKETGVPTIPLQEVEEEDPMMGVVCRQEIEEDDEMTLEQLTGKKKCEEEAHVLVASFMGGDTTLLEGDQPEEPEDEDGD